jgi:ligand-binding sensor domain-containing protein/putative methionine-R-sulfoxide reductase with GAF domain
LLLLTGLLSSYAQNSSYTFRHITAAEGLINNKVTALLQDKEGFMWIGTQAGLQRYDGTRFKNYLADVRDTSALQSDWISSIFEDSKNRLWFGSDPEGAYTLNRATGKFYNYNLHSAPENKINGIWNILEDRLGSIWIAGHGGLYKLNETTNQFEKYNSRLGLDKNSITGWLTIDENNNFWISTSAGIKFYDQRKKILYHKAHNPLHSPVFDLAENIGVTVNKNNTLWISCGRKLYRYDVNSMQLHPFIFEKPYTEKLNPDVQNEIITGLSCLQNGSIIAPLTARGIAVYQPQTNSFSIVEADNTRPYTYHVTEKSDGGICVAEDRSNNILIGSDKGINIFNPGRPNFRVHKRSVVNKDLFPETAASGFLQLPNEEVYISYYYINGGIVQTDSLLRFKKQYLYTENGNKNNSSNQVWDLFKDNKGIVWGPNQSNTMLKLNTLTGKITNEHDTALSGPVIMIRQDSNNIAWMAHWKKGLVKMDMNSRSKKFYTQFLFSDSSNIKRVQCILLDGDNIWAGTVQNGLQVFDKKKERFTAVYMVNRANHASISNNCVTDILQYNNDTLVIGTLMGVNIFDKKNKTFKAITFKEGLPNNLVQTVTKDGLGNVWVGCYSDGLCKINMHDFSVTSYTVNDGITDNIFSSKFYSLKNGTLLLGTSQGFLSFDPAKFTATAPPADVRLISVHVFENEIMPDALLKNNIALTLPYNQNSLRIAFSALEFWSPGPIKYYYKLEGADKEWTTADITNTAVYNQLKEGQYIFTVKCANRDGVFCSNITRFSIIIKPPFWKTGWFIILALAVVSLIVYSLVRVREKNINAIAIEKLKVQQLNAEQYRGKLELEQIINYFSSSLIDKHTIDDVLWDVAKNLIGRLGFVDCMFYMWNDDKTLMLQKAGFGPKDSAEEISRQSFTVLPGQGVVGHVMQTKEPVLISDTSADARYRPDDIVRLSEITVPVIYNNELLGILDSEHHESNFFTPRHLQILSTIATLVANKIKSIEAENLLQQKHIEIYSINEQLSKAKLEALRSQMNPHFIFNSLNAIQECILTNKVDAAYKYLSQFSKLQRMVLNNSEKELIPLSSEIEMLQLYLSLESLRFSDSFTCTINTAGITDASEIMIPSLITQPLAENAIWHGLRNKDGDKTLQITYEESNSHIFITIDDNGIGRQEAALIKKQKLGNEQFASKGTLILQQRLQVLSQQFNATLQLTVTDKKNAIGIATGTKAVLSFPSNLEIN